MNKKTVVEDQGFIASNNRMNMDSAAVPTPPSAKKTVEHPKQTQDPNFSRLSTLFCEPRKTALYLFFYLIVSSLTLTIYTR